MASPAAMVARGRDTDRVRIIDWKLGASGGSDDSLQMLIYGLWAEKKFRVEPLQVSARRVFPGDGAVEPERPLDRGIMVVGKARMLQDIELMKELDPYGRAGIEEVFSPCHRENVLEGQAIYLDGGAALLRCCA